MRRNLQPSAVALGVVTWAACSQGPSPDPEALAPSAQAIVYGADDRNELYEVDESLAMLARETSVALISPELLELQDDGSYLVAGPRHGEVQNLCPGEPFSEQVAAASCSGVLIRPDVVATAGHCLAVLADGRPDCTRNRYVRGFGLREPDASIRLTEDDVFDCVEVLGHVATPEDAPCHFDFVLLRLDRSAGASALGVPIRSRPVGPGEALVVIGYPGGLPVKVDSGARVVETRDERGDFFTLNSDTFAVSSGSGVFDTEGALVGLFSRGRRDYDQVGDCWRVHRESDANAEGYEQATHGAALTQLVDWVEDGTLPAVNEALFCHALDYAEVSGEQGPEGAMSSSRSQASGCVAGGAGEERSVGSVSWWLLIVLVCRNRLVRRRFHEVERSARPRPDGVARSGCACVR